MYNSKSITSFPLLSLSFQGLGYKLIPLKNGFLQLIFSLARYEAVMDAYIEGLEASGLSDLSRVTSVASFFVSRVDTLIDKMLEKIGSPEALDLRGKVELYLNKNKANL